MGRIVQRGVVDDMEYAKLQKASPSGIDKDEFVFHKVIMVQPLEDFRLEIVFECGQKKEYDIKPLIDKLSGFSVLRNDPGLFGTVKIEPGGYAISWNDEVDLASEELWNNGILTT